MVLELPRAAFLSESIHPIGTQVGDKELAILQHRLVSVRRVLPFVWSGPGELGDGGRLSNDVRRFSAY